MTELTNSVLDSNTAVSVCHSVKEDQTFKERVIPTQNPEITKSLKGIEAQGAMLSKKISTITFLGEMKDNEESKLDPLTLDGDSGNTYEGGLSCSPLLPPSATHTKKT